MPKPKVHVRMSISLDDLEFIPGNEGFCPIARVMSQDPEYLAVKVTDKVITFSRRSTDQRYWYRTPEAAVRFIHAVDAILETNEVPSGFTLVLTESDLIKIKDRGVRDSRATLHSANIRDNVVHVSGGRIEIEPRREPNRRGRRPNRVNAEVI